MLGGIEGVSLIKSEEAQIIAQKGKEKIIFK